MSSVFYPKSEAFGEFSTRLKTDDIQPRLTSCVVTKNNEIIVVDLNNKQVKMFEFFGDVIRAFGKDDPVKLRCPWDVTLAPNGDICITEVACACVRVFSNVGKYLRSVECCSEVKNDNGAFPQMTQDTKALTRQNSRLVTPSTKSPARQISKQGTKTLNGQLSKEGAKAPNRQILKDIIEEEPSDSEDFDVEYENLPLFPRGIDCHVTGKFVVSNSPPILSDACHNIYVINPADGSAVSKMKGAFSRPLYIASNPSSNSLLVSDTYRSMVTSYDSAGRCQYQYGMYGTGPQQLSAPHGICVDREGLVYVADHGNHRIVILKEGKLTRFIYGGLKYPTSVAHSTTGHLVVTEQHGMVKVFNLPRKIK